MSCLTELYFSSTGVRLVIVNVLSFELRPRRGREAGSDQPLIRSWPGSPMQAAAQSRLLVHEAVAERMVTPALRLVDLSVQFLDPLSPPAVHQLVEGFQKPDSSGRKTPFYHNLREPGNYSLPLPQSRAYPRSVWRGAGFCIESAESLVNIPAFRVEEDLGRRQLVQGRNRGGVLPLHQHVEHLLLQAAHQAGTALVPPRRRRQGPRRLPAAPHAPGQHLHRQPQPVGGDAGVVVAQDGVRDGPQQLGDGGGGLGLELRLPRGS